MTTKKLFLTLLTGLTFKSLSLGQSVSETLKTSSVIGKTDTSKNEKIRTLFSGSKKSTKPIKYLGLSVGSEFQYGSVAGEFTPMAGGTVMLHIDKKWGIGLTGYSTMRNFTPTALNANSLLEMDVKYGGLRVEYTPNPNAPIHVSFPLLIGGGMARVDSANSYRDGWKYGGRGRNDRRDGFNSDNTRFWVIQPGINVEANIIRYLKIYAGASYRLTPSVNTENTTTLPTPTAGQLSGLNLNVGIKVGLFDYKLHSEKRMKKEKIKKERG
ncbi:MAG: hypothetical protein U5N85_07165 [Arcicella sp.]|nr:hypothetical protein [Arcicella sp.]